MTVWGLLEEAERDVRASCACKPKSTVDWSGNQWEIENYDEWARRRDRRCDWHRRYDDARPGRITGYPTGGLS